MTWELEENVRNAQDKIAECEVVEIQICSLVLQPPRLIFALKIRSDVQTLQQRWRLPEQSHRNQPRGDGKTKSARTHLQQSCRHKVSLRKNVTG